MWGALGRSEIHKGVWCENLKEEENCKAKTQIEAL